VRFRTERLVVFTGSVIARFGDWAVHADRIDIYLDEKGDRILRTVSTGHVRIVTRDCWTATALGAEYDDGGGIVLNGEARVWRDDDVVTGDGIVIYPWHRSVIRGGKRQYRNRTPEATDESLDWAI
jgi:lipopolysaccharide transport protein LptA